MGRIRKLLALSNRERWLMVKAAALLATVRLMLSLLPFPRARRFFEWASEPSGRPIADGFPVARLAWAVEVTSAHVPGGRHCLTKAFAAQILLSRRGHPAIVRYGVLKNPNREFMAHAWLESGGTVIIGGFDPKRFAPLTPPGSPHP